MQGSRGVALSIDRASRVAIITFACVLVLDQVTKVFVRASMLPGQSETVVPGLVSFTYVRNPGGAFGLMPGSRPLLVSVAALVVLGIVVYWSLYRPQRLPMAIGLGLVAGGAVGNMVDRVSAGFVTDFLDVHIWPVFNVADTAVVIGIAILGLWVAFGPDSQGG